MGETSQPLALRVQRRTERLARRMLAAFVEEIPLYGHLPKEQLEGEILDILRYNLRTFFRYLHLGAEPDEHDLAAIRASAARRAEERIPLEDVLTAYHLGAVIGWEALVEEAHESERDELLEAASRVLRYTQAVSSAVASAYLEERQSIYGEERDARRALAEALLSGTETKALADRAGTVLGESYLVAALAMGTSPDETDEGVEGAVASRRKVRRVEQHLAAIAGDNALALLNPTGGVVLLPVRADERDEKQAGIPKLVDGLAAAAGATITAGVSWRPGIEGVEEAGRGARDVMRLACDQGRPPGTYRLDDVLLEYLLTRPSAAAERLMGVLDPLETGPELIATLEGYFAANFDRRKAAAALHVHPNTLDYRLRRVSDLTGLPVSSAHGLQVLGAALTIRRLRYRR